MRLNALLRAAALAAIVATGASADALAQTAADPHHPNPTLAQATPRRSGHAGAARNLPSLTRHDAPGNDGPGDDGRHDAARHDGRHA